jgi:hypothetical protein
LVSTAVAPVIREHHHCPRSHLLAAARTTLSLEESGRAVGCLVLKDTADLWIVESDFKCGSRDDDISVRIDADILGARSTDANAASRREDMADVLYERPVLTEFESFAGVREGSCAQVCE